MRKRNIFIIIIFLIILIVLAVFLKNKSDKFIELSKKEYSENIKNPDRIIYKSKNEDEYYIILPDEEIYNKIIEKLSENIGEINQDLEISQDVIDDISKNTSYIEFDYNTKSKNYIIPFDIKDKGIIKLTSTNGRLLNAKVKNVKSIRKIIEKDIKKNNRKSYTMNTNKEYISTNVLDSFPYRYKQQFKEVDWMVNQVVITNWEDYELYKAMCNLKLEEPLPEDVFDNNNLILTVAMTSNISVKISVGNLKYTYDNYDSIDHVHLLVVSKVVNSNCIYSTNNAIERSKQELENWKNEYNSKVDNIDSNVFVTNFEEYFSNKNKSGSISETTAKEIADKAFDEASRIAGSYDKSTQTMKKESVYANNFFTFKTNEGPKNYGSEKVKCYVYTREDEMGCGVSVYIDANTGKVIGGEAFGD